MSDETTAPRSRKKWLLENVISIGIALFLVLIIRSSIIEAYKIPSGSMIPTLLVGDHIFVNKFAYGIKVPFTEWFMDPIYIMKREPPKRGDIIVFKYPLDESIYYIKRVVGTPGDEIEVRNKRLYVNGSEVKAEEYSEKESIEIKDIIDPEKYSLKDLTLFKETLSGAEHTIMLDGTNYYTTEFQKIKVPEGKYFVMGDNRDHSSDSRFWNFVPMENVKGQAVVIWLSLWFDDFTFRPERIGTVLK